MAAAAADSRQHLANPGRGEAHTRHGDGDRCHRPPAAVQRHTNGDDCSFPLTAVSPYLRLLVVLRSRRRRASSSEPNPSSGTLDGGRAGRTLRRAGQPERLCRRTSGCFHRGRGRILPRLGAGPNKLGNPVDAHDIILQDQPPIGTAGTLGNYSGLRPDRFRNRNAGQGGGHGNGTTQHACGPPSLAPIRRR
jgi:hypothetical protein